MRTLPALIFFTFHLFQIKAQVTLVREAPNDTFDLACDKCVLTVADVAITAGQNAVPMNMKKPVTMNLLRWRYYDDILKKETLMAKEPYWTQATLLLDEVPDSELLSIHLNLLWKDSTDLEHRIYLVTAGLTKAQLARLPVTSVCDADTYALQRFSAIAQITETETSWETYDSTEGTCTINSLNPRTGAISGTFEFTANRVGMEKLGIFLNGSFQR